jgi:hypothetical protein
MHQHSKDDLARALDSQTDWLREQPGFASAYITKDAGGGLKLVLRFESVTPVLRKAAEERFAGLPVEVETGPIAKFYPGRG